MRGCDWCDDPSGCEIHRKRTVVFALILILGGWLALLALMALTARWIGP